METLIHADIFFFIASIGFSIFVVLGVILLLYAIHLFKVLIRITKKVEKDIDSIGDTAKEFVIDLRDSRIFSFLFGKRKK